MANQKKEESQTGVVVSPSQIQYTLISPHTEYHPDEFFDTAYRILRECPKDLLQLQDSVNFFEFGYKAGIKKSINLYTLPDQMFTGTAEQCAKVFIGYSSIFNKDLVKVFFIDMNCSNHELLGAMLSWLPFSYFLITGEPKEEIGKHYDLSKNFGGGHQLIDLIKADLPKISDAMNEDCKFEIKNFDFNSNKDANKINPYHPTLYCRNNYFTLNQILANYWLKRPAEPSQEELMKAAPNRVKWQMEQIKAIDYLHMLINGDEVVTPIEPTLPAMVIVAPFHFPRTGKLMGKEFKDKKEKTWFRVSQTEQLLDYSYEIDGETVKYLGQENVGIIMRVITQRLLNLDNLSYLHAQFGYGPTYRLPIIGKSLNMDLSHFQQLFSNKRNAIKKILNIGELMRERLVDEQFRQVLRKRNGQLVFISDLPMEWLKIGEYPLCLTHDICRLPEFNFGSLINNFVNNQRLNFRIRPDILKKTLVIHCASDDEPDMHDLFVVIDSLKPFLKFESVVCRTVEEISAAVRQYQPDLLIFDCHGDFDEKTLSSYLVVDDKHDVLLTGDDIIKHKISAPLVFISACSTMPNYGYVKFLSDAFFQAGAFSVTATFLPIKMLDASVLIIRLLNNLKQMDTKVIHCNWLAFISHTLRGILLFETVKKVREHKHLPVDVENDKLAELLTEMMVFERREAAFENLKKHIKSINPDIETPFESLNHEWLSYTTIGRADLIYFENWHQKHQLQNYSKAY